MSELPPIVVSPEKWRRLRRLSRPLRRVLGWVVLVYEERHFRLLDQQEIHKRLDSIETWLRDVRDQLEGRTQTLADRIAARADLLIEEAWRRGEARDSRLATEIQRLTTDMARFRRENSAILRILSGPRTELNGRVVVGDGAASSAAFTDLAAPEASDDSKTRTSVATEKLAPTLRLTRDAVFREVERGSRAETIEKLKRYLPYFRHQGLVLHLGCGRGEFLELAKWYGLQAYGVDVDDDAVEQCRFLGLDARKEDLLEHLTSLPNNSLAGIFSAHVVEHLHPERLSHLMKVVFDSLEPRGVAVIETPNPDTFATHFQSFWRDPTHLRPVPAAALSFAARSAGLVVDEIVYSAPMPEEERLKPLALATSEPQMNAVVDSFNELVSRLNHVLYGFQDYALVATKPPVSAR